MRIAYLSDQLLPQHATDTEQIASMVASLGQAGAHVDLVVPRRLGARGPTVEEIADYYEVAPSFDVVSTTSAYPSLRAIEKAAHGLAALRLPSVRRADAIYSRNLPLVLTALALTGKPVFYETYRPWPRQRADMNALFRALAGRRRLAGLVLHSDLAADSYRGVGFEEARLLVAHNGYDPERMRPSMSRGEARKALGLPADGVIATYAGHVSVAKGVGMLLDLARELPSLHLVIVGSRGHGPIEEEAEQLANVSIVPWQAFGETVPYLYAADILLIPPTAGPLRSVGNTVLPIKTFLYLAAGRAIFAPSTPDLCEVLVHGENAWLTTPDDPAAIERAFSELLGDAELRRRLAEGASTTAQPLTWSARADRVLAFVEQRLASLR